MIFHPSIVDYSYQFDRATKSWRSDKLVGVGLWTERAGTTHRSLVCVHVFVFTSITIAGVNIQLHLMCEKQPDVKGQN